MVLRESVIDKINLRKKKNHLKEFYSVTVRSLNLSFMLLEKLSSLTHSGPVCGLKQNYWQ